MSNLEATVTQIVDKKFQEYTERGLLRRAFTSVATVAILCLAARQCEAWWAIAGLMWLASFRIADLLLTIALVDKVNDEIQRRRDQFGVKP